MWLLEQEICGDFANVIFDIISQVEFKIVDEKELGLFCVCIYHKIKKINDTTQHSFS